MKTETELDEIKAYLTDNTFSVKIATSIMEVMEEYASQGTKGMVKMQTAKDYGEFCAMCEREGKPLLLLEDYIRHYGTTKLKEE